MSLTIKTSDLNSFGAVVMDGDVAVALCRPMQVWTKGEDGGSVSRVVTPEEALKNAHLFAAAPDLLAALQDVIGWVPGASAWHTDAPLKSVERARAAIAKATGKSL